MEVSELPDVGDFARIVEGSCCAAMAENIGDVALVSGITEADWACECGGCGNVYVGRIVRSVQWRPGDGYPHAWMRKVPPPADLVDEVEREAVPA